MALPDRRSQERSAEAAIGRLLGATSRGAARYVTRRLDDPARDGRLRLEWSVRSEWDDWSRHSEGCYAVDINVRDWSAEEMWKTYIQLSEAEAAFRIHTSELSLRPIWHQHQ